MRFDRLKAQRDRRAFSAEEKVLEFWGNQFPLKSHFPSNLSALTRINTHVSFSFSKRRRGQKTTTIEISLAVVFVFLSREEEEEEHTREKI